jgi:ketosteroid isomerase-like protein
VQNLPAIQGAILRVEKAWASALVAGDMNALGSLISDDAMVLHGSGLVEDKRAFLAGLPERLEIQSVELKNVLIRAYGDTAVLTAQQVQRARLKMQHGEVHTGHANLTRVYVKHVGDWRIASMHLTRLQS